MKKNKLVAVLGWKYESEEMVEDLKKNLSWVDDFAIIDCRTRDELWIHEGDYRLLGREKAREMGADWILITSPDERWEKNAGAIIRPMIDHNFEDKIYEFNLRELYHPYWYRTDGIWGNKSRRRLYPLKDTQAMKYHPIQCPSVPQGDFEIIHLDVNIYHTKMIEPENRTLRAKVFSTLDPEKKFQGIGYDYLDDETEAVVERIPEDRMYTPEYKPYIFAIPDKYFSKEELKEKAV